LFAHTVIYDHGETLAETQEAQPQSGFARDSTNSSHLEASTASTISTSAGRAFIRRGGFRFDATLVKLHRWVLLGYVAVLAFVAFWPTPVDESITSVLSWLLNFVRRHGFPEWFNYGFVEASANVLLFAPAGLLLAFRLPRKRWWQLLALGAAISGAVELGQLLLLPHRFSSWQDILMNTMGVGVGLLLAALLKRLPLRRQALSEP
jgi:hypothetical protein